MRAILYDRFGGPEVFEIREITQPQPGSGEILARVRAAALNPKDILVSRGKFRWISGKKFPRGLGYDWAGENVETGEKLYGMVNGWMGRTCAEFLVAKPAECAPLPAGLSFEEAAALPLVCQTGLQALRDLGRIKPGDRVLINGASGGVGTVAIQIAKRLGAEVATVSSSSNLELCRELGADHSFDYRKENPFAPGPLYDLVFDVFGNRSRGEALPILKKSGVYITTVPSAGIFWDLLKGMLGGPKARMVFVRSQRQDLETVTEYVAEGRLKPVIDKIYSLEEVGQAAAQLATKRSRGKLVLRI